MTEIPETEWQEIGNHLLRFEAPDIWHNRISGDLTLDQVDTLLKGVENGPKVENRFFFLGDIGDAGRPNLEILRSPDLVKRLEVFRALVYYRALFHHRTVVEIVTKISRTLNLSLSKVPIIAFATEAEARAWIDEYRQKND